MSFSRLVVAATLAMLCLAPRAVCAAPGPALQGAAKVNAMADDVLSGLVSMTDRHYHEGEYRHTVNLDRMILAGDPKSVDTYATAGWLLWSMDLDDQAVALYELGIRNNPNTYYMYDELGQYYFIRKKDWSKAIGCYEKAIAFKDCAPFTFHMLARAYEKNGQLDKAIATWERARSLPNNESVQMNIDRVQALMHPVDPEKKP